LPDTDYNVGLEIERERQKRIAEQEKRLANRTPEEKEADALAYQRDLLKCTYCFIVLGQKHKLGNDVDYYLKEHESECYRAQLAKKEQDALRVIQKKAMSLILTACVDSNLYRSAEHSFEMEPAPLNKDKPHDSEDYKFERDWNERKLTEQSDRLVYAWEDLIKFRDSSEEAKNAVNSYWKQQVSTYVDKWGLKMYHMKSFQSP